MTFHWAPEDKFVDGDSDRLASEVRSFMELRSASPPLPFHFALDIEGPPFGLTGGELELAVKSEAAKRPDVVELRRDTENARLIVQDRYLAVEMPGAIAASYDLDGDYDPGGAGEQLAIDLLTLVALAFARWRQADLAARMTLTYFARSTLMADPEAAMPLSSAMTIARRVTEALQVAEEIDAANPPGEDNPSMLFTLTPLQHSASLSEKEVDEYQMVMQKRIARREDADEYMEASRELVSLGNHHRTRQEPGPAIELYERALQFDPEYRDRAHYWHELAGVLFFTGRHRDHPTPMARQSRWVRVTWHRFYVLTR